MNPIQKTIKENEEELKQKFNHSLHRGTSSFTKASIMKLFNDSQLNLISAFKKMVEEMTTYTTKEDYEGYGEIVKRVLVRKDDLLSSLTQTEE